MISEADGVKVYYGEEGTKISDLRRKTIYPPEIPNKGSFIEIGGDLYKVTKKVYGEDGKMHLYAIEKGSVFHN